MSDDDEFASRLTAPAHRDLYAYWQSRRPAGALPSRSQIDPVDIPKLLPWIILYDVIWQDETPRFRFRLVGTGNVQRYGRDATGLWFEQAYEGDILARQTEAYTEVATTGRPHLSQPRLPVTEKEFVTYDRLILPLADDGQKVDQLIALMVFDAAGARAR